MNDIICYGDNCINLVCVKKISFGIKPAIFYIDGEIAFLEEKEAIALKLALQTKGILIN